MRPIPTFLLRTSLLCVLLLTTSARAQVASSDTAIETADDAGPGDNAATATTPEAALDLVMDTPEVAHQKALTHNAELLNELIQRSMKQTIKQQKFAAATGITGGMIMLGLASWRLIEKDPQSQYSRGLGVMFLTLGMVDLTTGVYAATRIPHERRRAERWDRARKDGITDVELAYFEGELHAAREIREGERFLVRWNGLTHALAGALVFAYTPIPDSLSRTDRVSGYVVGGLFVAVGIGAFAATFRETPSERAWKDYVARRVPMAGHEFHWSLAPSFSKRGAGISFGGVF